MSLLLRNVTPTIGTEVSGIDLNKAAQIEKHAGELRSLLDQRQVIFFRDQHVNVDCQVQLASLFGDPEPISSAFPPHPENSLVRVLKLSGARTGTDVWHADQSWQAIPPAGACLCAINVPESGGDTIWASTTAAFESLDPAFKEYLESLTVVHHWEYPEVVENVMKQDPSGARYRELRDSRKPMEHPMVMQHPRTGKNLIFANSLYTIRVKGLPDEQSRDLLGTVCRLVQVPERQVRFSWRAGDVAIWDNLATQHYAVNDYHPFPRLMHRVGIRQRRTAL